MSIPHFLLLIEEQQIFFKKKVTSFAYTINRETNQLLLTEGGNQSAGVGVR